MGPVWMVGGSDRFFLLLLFTVRLFVFDFLFLLTGNCVSMLCVRALFFLSDREVLDLAGKAVKVGATTDDVDRVCHEAAVERGAYPSPLNYQGFPKR